MTDKINGNTPEEIKTGLHCVAWDDVDCSECVYKLPEFEDCVQSAAADALAYIQQLEAERDAAVEELRRTHNCNICKHHKKSGGTCEGWSVCGYNIPNWEWRGIREVKTDE